MVKGSLVLVGGEPGIGKSTLMLQVAAALAGGNGTDEGPALYVSGEESVAQVQHHTSQPYVPLHRLKECVYVSRLGSGLDDQMQVSARAIRLGIREPALFLMSETDAGMGNVFNCQIAPIDSE